jgi:hypothetical protein
MTQELARVQATPDKYDSREMVNAIKHGHRWKGGKTVSHGYAVKSAPGHPKATSNSYVYEHILVAEVALGRVLPKSAVVHHVDLCSSNNRNSNLVICQDQAYHMLLHARLRIQRAGGDPNLDKICGTCKKVLSRQKFGSDRCAPDRLRGECRECAARRGRDAYRRKRGVAA